MCLQRKTAATHQSLCPRETVLTQQHIFEASRLCNTYKIMFPAQGMLFFQTCRFCLVERKKSTMKEKLHQMSFTVREDFVQECFSSGDKLLQ